jgi:hypothetical protein
MGPQALGVLPGQGLPLVMTSLQTDVTRLRSWMEKGFIMNSHMPASRQLHEVGRPRRKV